MKSPDAPDGTGEESLKAGAGRARSPWGALPASKRAAGEGKPAIRANKPIGAGEAGDPNEPGAADVVVPTPEAAVPAGDEPLATVPESLAEPTAKSPWGKSPRVPASASSPPSTLPVSEAPASGETTPWAAAKAPARTGKMRAKHPNSHAREVVLQALYQMEVGGHTLEEILRFKWLNQPLDAEKRAFCERYIREISRGLPILEAEIASLSKKHITQISAVNRCILRMAAYELSRAELDARITIDDALNLTRKYEGEESVGFVNGILDAYETRRLATPADPS